MSEKRTSTVAETSQPHNSWSAQGTSPRPAAARERTILAALGLAVFVYASYLLFYSGVFHSSDAEYIVAATESMAKRGEFSTPQLWWHQDAIETVAPNAEPYSKYGIAASLMALPLYFLALKWPLLGMVQAVMLTNLLITAANAALVFKLVSLWGYRTPVALGTALLFALGTSAMVYARTYFTEPLSALSLTGAVLGLYLHRVTRQERYAWLAGGMMGLAISTKLINALFLVPLLAYFAAYSLGSLTSPARAVPGRGLWPTVRAGLPVGLPLAVTLAALGLYNAVRFGSPFTSGYPAWERFDHPLLVGLWGLLFGGEKGLFVYNPILLASLLAFPLFWRRRRAEAMVVLAVCALHALVYAGWHDWRGGVAWGPRFLVPLLPLLVLPLAPLLAWLGDADHRRPEEGASAEMQPHAVPGKAWKRAVGAGLLALAGISIAVQVLGSAVSFLRYGQAYDQWAAQSSSTLERLAREWPVLGHALLFRPANWDMSWVQVGDNRVVIDWVTLALLAGLLLVATFGLVAATRPRRMAPGAWQPLVLLVVLALAVSVSLALLIRSRADNRFGGGPDYLALLETLAAASRRDDLVLLNNHTYTEFFMNNNRSLARWVALDRFAGDPERTRGLLERSAGRYRHIWLATDLATGSAEERPVEAWLSTHAYKITEVTFSPYARLLLYEAATGRPANRQTLGLRLGERIRLAQFDLSYVDRSQPVRLTLYWQASEPVAEDLSVFVQLLDASGQLAWQTDRYPVDGFRPTSSWQVGEVISDRYAWGLPSEMPPGQYTLIAGLYNWRTGERLAVFDPGGELLGDHVVLGQVDIPPSADAR